MDVKLFLKNVTPKEVKLLVCYTILTVVFFCFFLYHTKQILYLLSTCFWLSFVVTGLVLSRFKKWENNWGIIVSIIFAIFSVLPMTNKPNLTEILNHLFYGKNDSVEFKDFTNETNLTHKFIFCFDNTGGRLKKYNDLMLKQLRFDLKQVWENSKKTDEIIVVKLYDPDYHFSAISPSSFIDLDKADTNIIINNLIKKCSNYKPISNLHAFYSQVVPLCDNNTTLFMYSDFVHDLTYRETTPNMEEIQELNEHEEEIRNYQQQLLENHVTTIVYHIPNQENIKPDERMVLPHSESAKTNNIFLQCYDIMNIKQKRTTIPLHIKQIDDRNLHFYFYETNDPITSELTLKFENFGNHIDKGDNTNITIKDGNGNNYQFDPKQALKTKEAFITYNGPKPTEDKLPELKIIQDKVHYFIKCAFVPSGVKYTIYWYILGSIIIGVTISSIFMVKKQP